MRDVSDREPVRPAWPFPPTRRPLTSFALALAGCAALAPTVEPAKRLLLGWGATHAAAVFAYLVAALWLIGLGIRKLGDRVP